ncbi:extracellular matrix regulator RemB [Chengkuizengella sp. SCS-71B]|uniref:extracellular matrix regulator RemB n=1 Tax=Chengkuizengella sp. SCS-71B TaxID=3115290 RepID=UPI0032C21D61
MFIHLGGDKILKASELVAIFDLSIDKSFVVLEPFINHFTLLNRVEKISKEKPKSLIISTTKIYYSPISSATLKKRANFLHI